MHTDHETVSRPARPGWEAPDCEQISLSAEATAYVGRAELD